MSVFLSYSRTDEQLVQLIHDQLDLMKHEAFFDRDMVFGQQWWDVLLERIRECTVFVFVLSPDSIESRACAAELAWAVALGKPLLAVMVREVPIEKAPDAFQLSNIQDLTFPETKDWYALDHAIDEIDKAPIGREPVDELPEPPPPPIADLSSARSRLESSELSGDDQRDLVAELGSRVHDPSERRPVVALLERLRDYPDVLADVKQTATELVDRYGEEPLDPRSSGLLESVVDHLREHECTPILGTGMTDWLFGSRMQLAQQWAHQHSFPMGLASKGDLPQVAQYLAVRRDAYRVRRSLRTFYLEQLEDRFGDVVGDTDDKSDLDQVIVGVWKQHAPLRHAEPHRVLAATRCPIYITTQPTTLLVEALKAEGCEPETDFCPWSLDPEEWPESPLHDPEYEPSPERPFVYHVFGTLSEPDSVVITEDDYFEFLAAVSQNDDLIPKLIQERMADSSLMFLGFGSQDWDVRVLLRGLLDRETFDRKRRREYKHVAAIMNDRAVASPKAARTYIEQYFQDFRKPPIQVYWASVNGFCAALAKAWDADG